MQGGHRAMIMIMREGPHEGGAPGSNRVSLITELDCKLGQGQGQGKLGQGQGQGQHHGQPYECQGQGQGGSSASP